MARSFGLCFKPRYLVYWGLPDKSDSLSLAQIGGDAEYFNKKNCFWMQEKEKDYSKKKKEKTNRVRWVLTNAKWQDTCQKLIGRPENGAEDLKSKAGI